MENLTSVGEQFVERDNVIWMDVRILLPICLLLGISFLILLSYVAYVNRDKRRRRRVRQSLILERLSTLDTRKLEVRHVKVNIGQLLVQDWLDRAERARARIERAKNWRPALVYVECDPRDSEGRAWIERMAGLRGGGGGGGCWGEPEDRMVLVKGVHSPAALSKILRPVKSSSADDQRRQQQQQQQQQQQHPSQERPQRLQQQQQQQHRRPSYGPISSPMTTVEVPDADSGMYRETGHVTITEHFKIDSSPV